MALHVGRADFRWGRHGSYEGTAAGELKQSSDTVARISGRN